MPAPPDRARATVGRSRQASPLDRGDAQAYAPVRVPFPTAAVRRRQKRKDREGTAFHLRGARHPPPPRPTRADPRLTSPGFWASRGTRALKSPVRGANLPPAAVTPSRPQTRAPSRCPLEDSTVP